MFDKVKSLQEEFKKEATNAPMLFKDLARVEQYIAESYKTRSFIELVQNADDACSKNFGIHIYDNFVVVGNDGRDFNDDDIKAICRSGSSNKVRGGNTIGYRGIGFKSVVNLAERIYILSGKTKFMYDKETTKRMLNTNNDVPLIRIPHPVDTIPYIDEINNLKEKYKYTTIFLFENIKENIVENELQQFDKSSLLFLNSVNAINLVGRNNTRRIIKKEQGTICQIFENDETEEWRIISYDNKYDKLAFKIKNNTIISANIEESVIHSFTPTTEVVGGYFKINGNFSTDPSRKNIDFDEYSEQSFKNCTKKISEIIIEILKGNNNYIGFFKPFVEFNNAISSNKIRVKLLNQIKEHLEKYEFFHKLRLKPEMISIQDYNQICKNKYSYINGNILLDYPEINNFFELIEVKYLTLEEMLNCIDSAGSLSEIFLATLLGKIIKKYRYDFSGKILENLLNSKIFITEKKGQADSKAIKKYSELSKKYLQVLNDNCDTDDIQFAFKKLNIEYDIDNVLLGNMWDSTRLTNETKTNIFSNVFRKNSNINNENSIQNSKISEEFNTKKYPNIQKWRSSEINLVEYLRYFDIVETVKDVSISNLGYDIEVKLKNGRRLYIEVKSMMSFSQPFKITNNEYTCAHNYGDDYYIALVINDDTFKVKFIRNPIEALHFEKKCEQWSWFCDEYKNNLIDIENI